MAIVGPRMDILDLTHEITPAAPGNHPACPPFVSPDVAAARRFYLDLDLAKDRPLVVICGGLAHCTPDYAICRESFPFYSIEMRRGAAAR
jgi:hypothetical protein